MKKYMIWLVVCMYSHSVELNTNMQEYINTLKIEAKQQNANFVDFDKNRGEKIFSTKMYNQKANSDISCISCHKDLVSNGTNIFTNQQIDPLAPSKNNQRLTDVKEVKKWLKRNFNDVYGKEGSAEQKGDVLYYIMSK